MMLPSKKKLLDQVCDKLRLKNTPSAQRRVIFAGSDNTCSGKDLVRQVNAAIYLINFERVSGNELTRNLRFSLDVDRHFSPYGVMIAGIRLAEYSGTIIQYSITVDMIEDKL